VFVVLNIAEDRFNAFDLQSVIDPVEKRESFSTVVFDNAVFTSNVQHGSLILHPRGVVCRPHSRRYSGADSGSISFQTS